MPAPAQPLHPRTAVGCAVVAIALLLFLPWAAATDPGLGTAALPGEAGWWLAVAVLLTQAALVSWVGRAPAVLPPVVSAVPLIVIAATPGAVFSIGAVAVATAVFLAVVARSSTRLWPGLLCTGLVLGIGQFANEVHTFGTPTTTALITSPLHVVIVVGLPLLLGLVIASRRDADAARTEQVAALRREQGAVLQAEMARQRTALSRELHDIAAHHMSGIAVIAAAMDRQIDSDPATAKQSARQIREQSRAVLDDLRRLVGLLREEADAARPVETLESVTALVEERRAYGAEIDLVVPEHVVEPGPLTQLVVYRMVQESLANAAAHAPGAHCVVELAAPDATQLQVRVRNGVPTGPDRGPGGGFGLLGMAERAQLVGAELRHGPTSDGGWEVALTLPLDDPPPLPLDDPPATNSTAPNRTALREEPA
ncbi:sensor histidine kinase [Pseudonocardia phyllosphaerae]|uniref:sensor histidine kinase n=1 Tax=Pseudonocardia phyllosphaerae TaxID=3390502 RepID=UPI0039789F4E